MDTQVRDQIEGTLRQQWDSLWPQIAERFTTVSKADLDAAINVDDLVARISDKSDYSPKYVDGTLGELCGVGVASSGFSGRTDQGRQQQQRGTDRPFGHSHSSESAGTSR